MLYYTILYYTIKLNSFYLDPISFYLAPVFCRCPWPLAARGTKNEIIPDAKFAPDLCNKHPALQAWDYDVLSRPQDAKESGGRDAHVPLPGLGFKACYLWFGYEATWH